MSDEIFRGNAFPGDASGNIFGNARWMRPEAATGDPWYLPAGTRARQHEPVAPVIPAPRTSPENRG